MSIENRKFLKELIVLAIPAGMQMVITMVVNLIDNLMIGSLGEASITAVSVCGNFTWLATMAVMGLANGATVLCAQDYGRGETARIKKLLSFVIAFSFAISFVLFVITAIYPVEILKIYSSYDFVIEPGVGYLKYIKYSYIFTAISLAATTIMRSVRVVKLGFYASICSCFANVFFNWVFIFGNLGAPALGAKGAAIGTLISRIIECSAVLIYVLYIDKKLEFRLKDFDIFIEKDLLKQFFIIAMPLVITELLNNLITTAQTMITGRVSEIYISANSITHNAWILPNVFCFGVGMAASIMIGNLLGSKDFEKADDYARKFVKVALIMGTVGAILVQFILPVLSGFYDVTAETKLLARKMGYIASFNVIFTTFTQVVTEGVIKAGGKTNRLLKINLLANWVLILPISYFAAFVLHSSPLVLYFLLRSGNIIRTLWSVNELKKGSWKLDLAAKVN